MASQGDPGRVRDATFAVMRERGLTTIFANPGSTEVSFLGALPDDIRFVLALHEGSVVGIASGYAIGSGEPAFVLLHTTAGLGNAVAALATARVNRAPLVVRGRAAGPPPRGLRAVPDRAARGAGRRLPGLGRAAGARAGRARRRRACLARGAHRARPRARDRADGRLARARGCRAPGRRAGAAARGARPRAGGRGGAGRPARRGALARARGGRRRRLARRLGGAHGARRAARLPGLAGVVRGPRRLPPGPPAVRRPPAGRARRGCATRSPATTSSSWWGRAVFRQYPFQPGSFVGGRHADRARDRRPGRGAPQPGGPRAAGLARRGLLGAGDASCPGATPSRPRASRGPRRPTPRRPAGRCGPATCWPRSPSGCPRTWCSWRRRPRTGRSCTRASPRAARSGS